MNKKTIITALLALVAFILASCGSDDDNEDKVELVTLYVSAETGTNHACQSSAGFRKRQVRTHQHRLAEKDRIFIEMKLIQLIICKRWGRDD